MTMSPFLCVLVRFSKDGYRPHFTRRLFFHKRRGFDYCMLSLVLMFVVVVVKVASEEAICLQGTPESPYPLSQRKSCLATGGGDEGGVNPLLDVSGLPRFEEIHAKHVVPGITAVIEEVEKGLEEIENQLGDPSHRLSWSAISDPLERLGYPLGYSWGIVNHLNGVRNNEELRQAHQKIQPAVVKVSTRLAQSIPVYNAMKRLGESMSELDGPQKRILASALRDARHAGAELEGQQKAQFNDITLQLAKLSSQFNNNVLDATKAFQLDLTDPADVDGLPDSLKQLMAANAAAEDKMHVDSERGPWRVTLDGPCIDPFLKHSRNRALREQVYLAYITRASNGSTDNTGLIEDMRRLRQEKSKILGYSSFAELSLKSKMAETPEKVWELINSLKNKSRSVAEREHEELQQFASANGHSGQLKQWDIAYWAERQREHLFSFNDEDLRPYFPLPGVLEGLFNLTTFLFGVHIKPSNQDIQVWCGDVRFFDITDGNGNHLASFFLDPYSRPSEKRGGAWMDQCIGMSKLMKTKPVAHLVCNQTPPQKDKPSLMTFREVETLFHEFGHGLQHMLTTVPYAAAAGIANVEWDAVELPSQFMENWLYDDSTIQQVGRHYQHGGRVPVDMFEKVKQARKYRAGYQMLRQLHFSSLDMELHTRSDHWMDVKMKMDQDYALKTLPPLKEDRFPCSFMHIFGGGYAAGYYSYKWAEVLAADAFGAFEEAGLDNRDSISEIGRRFRDTVLSLGGGTHPTEVFKKFRGRDPLPDALLRLYGMT